MISFSLRQRVSKLITSFHQRPSSEFLWSRRPSLIWYSTWLNGLHFPADSFGSASSGLKSSSSIHSRKTSPERWDRSKFQMKTVILSPASPGGDISFPALMVIYTSASWKPTLTYIKIYVHSVPHNARQNVNEWKIHLTKDLIHLTLLISLAMDSGNSSSIRYSTVTKLLHLVEKWRSCGSFLCLYSSPLSKLFIFLLKPTSQAKGLPPGLPCLPVIVKLHQLDSSHLQLPLWKLSKTYGQHPISLKLG